VTAARATYRGRVPALTDDDHELIERATRLVETHGDDRLHTVGAAARAADGSVVAGLNLFHFTGGPCAEIVVLGMAASAGVRELTTMVAVADRGRGVIPPCGRCRQIMLDLHPEIDVIMPGVAGVRKTPIWELMPSAWPWTPEGGSEPPPAS